MCADETKIECMVVEPVIVQTLQFLHFIISQGSMVPIRNERREVCEEVIMMSLSKILLQCVGNSHIDFVSWTVDDCGVHNHNQDARYVNPNLEVLKSVLIGLSVLCGNDKSGSIDRFKNSIVGDKCIQLIQGYSNCLKTAVGTRCCGLSTQDRELLVHFSSHFCPIVNHGEIKDRDAIVSDTCTKILESDFDAMHLPETGVILESEISLVSAPKEGHDKISNEGSFPTEACEYEKEEAAAAVALEAKYRASLDESERLRHRLMEVKCKEESASLSAIQCQDKITSQEIIIEELYEKLLVLGKSESALKKSCQLLEIKTERLENDLRSVEVSESVVRIKLAESSALTDHYKSEADSKSLLLETSNRDFQQLDKEYHSLMEDYKVCESKLVEEANTCKQLDEQMSGQIKILNEKLTMIQSELEDSQSETCVLKAELIEKGVEIHNRDNELKTTTERISLIEALLEDSMSESNVLKSNLASQEIELIEAKRLQDEQKKYSQSLESELSKQKELLMYISKAAASGDRREHHY